MNGCDIGTTILGHVENVTSYSVRGWVCDPDKPTARVLVDIWLAGEFVGRVPANLYREDLRAAGIGNGCHGFCFRFPLGQVISPDMIRVATESGVDLPAPSVLSDEDSELRLPGFEVDSPVANFLSAVYQRHNYRRIEHLATLVHVAQIAIPGQSVLETGAGIGDHTSFFLDRGCSVLSIEPRAENVKVFRQRYADHPYRERLRIEQLDVENISRLAISGFDVVYSYGMLYHCAEPERVIASLCEVCSGVLLLETRVGPETAPDARGLVGEDTNDVSNSFHGGGCRPTREFIFRRLSGHMPYVYTSRTQPWHEEFPTLWTRANTASPASRAIFIGSRYPLNSTHLIRGVPTVCTRF